MSAETINGARIVLETLHRLGVTDMFGYPGGAVIPIYDEIYSFPEIKHYFVRHEQGAAHAADGYARVSGRVGVCLATSGPGATNLVTGIMTAYMDSVPMVAITGQVGVLSSVRIPSKRRIFKVLQCRLQSITILYKIFMIYLASLKKRTLLLVQAVQVQYLSIFQRIFKQKKYP